MNTNFNNATTLARTVITTINTFVENTTFFNKLIIKAIIIGQTSTLSIFKSVEKILGATTSSIVYTKNLIKTIFRAVTSSQPSTVILVVTSQFLRTISVIQESTTLLAKKIYKSASPTVSSALSFNRRIGKLAIYSMSTIATSIKFNSIALKITTLSQLVFYRLNTIAIRTIINSTGIIDKFISKGITLVQATRSSASKAFPRIIEAMVISSTTIASKLGEITAATVAFFVTGFNFTAQKIRTFGSRRTSPIETNVENRADTHQRTNPIDTDAS